MATKKSNSKSSKSSAQRQVEEYARTAQQAVSFAKRHPRFTATVAIILAIMLLTVAIIYFFFPEVYNRAYNAYYQYVQMYYNDSTQDDGDNYTAPNVVTAQEGDLNSITGAELSIHFLELGNKYAGDCTLIKVGDTEVLIDAGSRTSSATTICDYVAQYCTDGVLEYVVATHAHQDHLAAFYGKKDTSKTSGMTGVLYNYGVGTIITYDEHNSTSTVVTNFEKSITYALEHSTDATRYKATELCVDSKASEPIYLNDSHTVSMTVLYNYYYDHKTADENDYSVCILLSQTVGSTTNHYLFTGDLEGDGEKLLVKNNTLPQVVLFKGAHHGSKTSSTKLLLDAIQPQYVAVCCCAGSTEYTSNNDNTFPTQAFCDRVSNYTDKVYATSLVDSTSPNGFVPMNGNIVFYFDTQVKLYCSNNTTLLKDTEWFKTHRQCPTAWV